MTQTAIISASQVLLHNSPSDCWIVIDDQVWDMTDFAHEHPGGAEIIYKYAGRDASKPYSAIHSPSIIREGLSPSKLMGTLDIYTIDDDWLKPPPSVVAESSTTNPPAKPPLESLISARDFELAAEATASRKTWAFYSSADTDLITRDANKSFYSRIWLRPRVMRNVTSISTKSTVLGQNVALPIMASPAAMVKLIHPDGELAIARAAAEKGIIQCISTAASYTISDIATSTNNPRHPFFFQLYVDRKRDKSETLIDQINQHENIKAVFVTVDAATAGKREADERVKADDNIRQPIVNEVAKNDEKGGGLARNMGSFIDPGLCWDDIKWLRSRTTLPLVLKGIMSADDAKLAFDHGLDGIMFSNHGGRNLDTSPPSILVLLECHRRFPEIFLPRLTESGKWQAKRMEIFIDGGIRRGTSILKALCLGATCVGLGRSFLYATGYGQEGVEHLVDILRDELEVAMRNCGITCIADVGPELVNTADLDHLVMAEGGHPYVRDWRRGGESKRTSAKL